MIVCNDRTMLTTGALTLAARSGVNIAVVDRYSGLTAFLNTPHDRSTIRRAQYTYVDDPTHRLDIARRIVDAKVANSVTLLRRTPARWQRIPLDTAVRLNHPRVSARTAPTPAALLGIEGSAARLYFHGLKALIPEDYSFTGRRRRPPTDPVNAMLSYGYTIRLAETTRALELASLDATIGFLHTPHRGRPSLALDLMEEFRTLIVDTAVLRIIATHAVTPEGFDTPHWLSHGQTHETCPDHRNRTETINPSQTPTPSARDVIQGLPRRTGPPHRQNRLDPQYPLHANAMALTQGIRHDICARNVRHLMQPAPRTTVRPSHRTRPTSAAKRIRTRHQ